MKLMIEANQRVSPTFGLCIFLLLILTLEIRSQETATDGGLLPPPKLNLLPVHWPELSKLEPQVRAQLISSQNSLIAVAKDPATPDTDLSEAYGAMGQIYHAYSLINPARECYLNASRLAPKDFRWAYLLGKLDQQQERFDQAIQRFAAARRLRPDYVATAVNLGNIYLQLNRLENAEENFQVALTLDKNNAAAHYGLGQVALSRRRYSEAAGYFEKALAQLPDANRIHYSLAMAYRSLGETEKAKAHLAQQGTVGVRVTDPLVDVLPELIAGERVHLIRGKLALEAKRYAEAADEFRKAIAAQPNSLEARVNLGAVLTQTGDVREAFAQFEEAVRINPKSISAHYNLAVLLANENKHEPAIAQLQIVIGIDPNDVSARFLMARQLVKANRPEEALAEFTRIVREHPDNEDALIEQTRLLLQQKQYQQARYNLEKGHAQYPRKGRTVVMLAYLLAASPRYDLRDGARALELAQLAYKATGSINHGMIVAMALAELGRCDEAAEWLRQMTTKASGESKPEMVEKLKSELRNYEAVRPCRPEANLSWSDQLPSQ